MTMNYMRDNSNTAGSHFPGYVKAQAQCNYKENEQIQVRKVCGTARML